MARSSVGQFVEDNVFNLDEAMLFYKMARTKSAAQENVVVTEKRRVTMGFPMKVKAALNLAKHQL